MATKTQCHNHAARAIDSTQFRLWPPSSSSFTFFITKEALTNKPCLVAPDRLPSRLRSQVSTPVSSASVRPSTELGAKESQYIHLLTKRADCTSEHLHRPRSATRYRPLSLSTQGRHKVVGRKLNSPSWRQAKKWVAGRKMSCSLYYLCMAFKNPEMDKLPREIKTEGG